MNTKPSLNLCKSYLDSHLRSLSVAHDGPGRVARPPFVTLSRETGAGAITLSVELAAWLNANDRQATAPWTVFDKNLVGKVLEDHHLSSRLAEFIPEDRVSEIEAAMRELLGLHPPLTTLHQQLAETILGLAQMGRCILVGRGANIITASQSGGFHARLVGSLEKKIARTCAYYELTRREAIPFMKKEDLARARYIRKNFDDDIHDPMLYHLVINTDRIPCDEAAVMIGRQILAPRDPVVK